MKLWILLGALLALSSQAFGALPPECGEAGAQNPPAHVEDGETYLTMMVRLESETVVGTHEPRRDEAVEPICLADSSLALYSPDQNE